MYIECHSSVRDLLKVKVSQKIPLLQTFQHFGANLFNFQTNRSIVLLVFVSVRMDDAILIFLTRT